MALQTFSFSLTDKKTFRESQIINKHNYRLKTKLAIDWDTFSTTKKKQEPSTDWNIHHSVAYYSSHISQ